MTPEELLALTPKQKYFEFHYLKALCKMLPMGRLWVTLLKSAESIPANPDDRNTFVSTLSVIAAELARLDKRVEDFFRESIPGLSVELLPDYEAEAGLPELGDTLAPTIAERQALVQAKLRTNHLEGLQEDFYIAYAASLGYEITFSAGDYGDPFVVGLDGTDPYDLGSYMGDYLSGDEGNLVQGNTIIVTVLGGTLGAERLIYNLEYLKPGHILLVWESIVYNRIILFNTSGYTFAPIGIGTLTNGEATDSDLYATNHTELNTAYNVKELTTIYDDSYDEYQKKPTNVSYCTGPLEISDGMPVFDYSWAIWSTPAGDLYARNLDTVITYDLRALYPDLDVWLTGKGFQSLFSAAFDMSGTPICAFETAPSGGLTGITEWNSEHGTTSWTGYSPMVVCNAAIVPYSNPDGLLTDTFVLYLEETGGSVTWTYDVITGASEQPTDAEDTRYSNKILCRIQRDLFAVEYTVCTITDFDIAYIENAWINGDPDDMELSFEYKLYISVRATDGTRHTLESATYFVTNAYLYNKTEYKSLTASIVSGVLEEAVIEEDLSGSPEAFALTVVVSGAIEEAGNPEYDATETTSLTASIQSGSIEAIVTTASQQTETTSLTASIQSGSIEAIVTTASQQTETTSLTAGIQSGIIETV